MRLHDCKYVTHANCMSWSTLPPSHIDSGGSVMHDLVIILYMVVYTSEWSTWSRDEKPAAWLLHPAKTPSYMSCMCANCALNYWQTYVTFTWHDHKSLSLLLYQGYCQHWLSEAVGFILEPAHEPSRPQDAEGKSRGIEQASCGAFSEPENWKKTSELWKCLVCFRVCKLYLYIFIYIYIFRKTRRPMLDTKYLRNFHAMCMHSACKTIYCFDSPT